MHVLPPVKVEKLQKADLCQGAKVVRLQFQTCSLSVRLLSSHRRKPLALGRKELIQIGAQHVVGE